LRIQTIEITNYKAFLQTHRFKVVGKNLFIYGENGSGKSSLYYALKDFFQVSVEDIDLKGLENIFVPAGEEGKTAIKVTFKPNPNTGKGSKEYLWNGTTITSRNADVTGIAEVNVNLITFQAFIVTGGPYLCEPKLQRNIMVEVFK